MSYHYIQLLVLYSNCGQGCQGSFFLNLFSYLQGCDSGRDKLRGGFITWNHIFGSCPPYRSLDPPAFPVLYLFLVVITYLISPPLFQHVDMGYLCLLTLPQSSYLTWPFLISTHLHILTSSHFTPLHNEDF